MDAPNGDAFERGVCAKQMLEAAGEIQLLRNELSERPVARNPWHYPAHNLDLPNMPEPDQIVVVYYRYDDGSERGPVVMTPITSSGVHAPKGDSIFQPITRWCAIPEA